MKIFYTEKCFDVCPLCGGNLETHVDYIYAQGVFDVTECDECNYVEVDSLEVAKMKLESGKFEELVII